MPSYVYELLDRFRFGEYLNMTFRRYRPILFHVGTPGNVVGVGVRLSGSGRAAVAIGLGLATMQPATGRAEVLSLYVRPPYRGRGIAKRLLAELEAVLTSWQCREMTGVYMAGGDSTAALEAVLASQGWEPPVPRVLVCRSDYEHATRAPSMRHTALPPAYRIESWASVNAADRRALRDSQAAEGWIPPDLLPFDYEGLGIDGSPPEPKVNLVLRYNGAVAGWLLTHRISSATLRFTCVYARRHLRRYLPFIPLVLEGVQRGHRAGYSYGSWTVSPRHPKMFRFVRRHLEPYINEVRETRGVRKRLVPPAAT